MGTVISWTNQTWNPVSGCSRVSDGCRYCYAEKLSLKFGRSKLPWTAENAEANIILHPDRLNKPYGWKQPSKVFVNSMSDLFHPLVPDYFIRMVMDIIADTPQHTYQILTKRPERMAKWPYRWPANAWAGTTIESARHLNRADLLRQVPATRFISAEPLLGPLTGIDLTGIDWIIVGGESGLHLTGPEHPRWMRQEWAREIRDMAVAQNVAYFYKQDSGKRTELRCWLVEADGSRWVWHQYPGQLTPPERVGEAPILAIRSSVTAQ